MNVSQEGVELIKHFESCKLKAYRDSGGVLTIGYGHTGIDVHEGLEINQGKAELLLQQDLDHFERGVERAVHVAMTPPQFSAMVSLAYNVGLASFERSTLLKRFNARRTYDASNEFLRWSLDGDKILPGLAIRRMAERLMYLNRDWKVVI